MVHHKQTAFYQDGSVKKGVQSYSLKKNTEITKKHLSMLVQQMSVYVFFGMNAKE